MDMPSRGEQMLLLPPESEAWIPLEVNLFLMSHGAYHPGKMAQRRRFNGTPHVRSGATGAEVHVRGRVSIVAPSMSSRQRYHENLWRCFEAQTWEDKELIVVETYEDQPSEFLLRKAAEDSRLVHVCIQRDAGTDFTVGLKRNMTLHLASGKYVVNFDDDDLYAANYVSTMVGEMQANNLEAMTLSSWYNYYAGRGLCTYSDPEGWGEWAQDPTELEAILYGYGFSYVHKRQSSLKYPYPNVGFAEDAPFLLKLREVYGDDSVALRKDREGLCMHIMHRANTAQVLGTETVTPDVVAGLAVAELKPFQKFIDSDFSWWSPWRPPVRPPAMTVDAAEGEATPTPSNKLRSDSFDKDAFRNGFLGAFDAWRAGLSKDGSQ